MGKIVEIPMPQKRTRRRRISDAALATLAEKVQAGHWVSEDEGTHVKSCAYQRAQSIAKLLKKNYGIDGITTTAYPHPDHEDEILSLEDQIKAIEKDAEGLTMPAEIDAFKAECVQLREQILKLGGYLWALGPIPEGE